MNGDIAIFSGNAHPSLARSVCAAMETASPKLGDALVSAFSDGETRVQIGRNVRGADVYVIQPTSAPANHNIMELLIMVDALRRASAGSITAVIPYYGYARQERKSAPRTPITAKLVTDLLVEAGVNRIVSVDLHAAPIQGFTNLPFDNLFAKPVLQPYLAREYAGAVIVSPDAGGFERADAYSKVIPGSTVAVINKRRERPNESKVMNVIGDVDGKACLILDDMFDTAGTTTKAAQALLDRGAKSVAACAMHGVFSGRAAQNIDESCLTEVVVTDTVPLPAQMLRLRTGDPDRRAWTTVRLTTISVAPLIAEAICRIHNNVSVSELFN